MTAKKRAQKAPEADSEIEYDADPETGGSDASAKVKKLKAELAACKKERQEYLDGWQRLRADVANQKRDSAGSDARAQMRAREDILADLLSVLDSFDMAMKGSGWESVDSTWRQGVEYIYANFTKVLEDNGIEAFGSVGDLFDPLQHEATGEVPAESEKQDGKIATVVQRGYRIGEKTLRPARVIVARWQI